MSKKININGKNATEIFKDTIESEIKELSDKKLERAICRTLIDMYGFSACDHCDIPHCANGDNSNMFMNRYSYLLMLYEEYNKRNNR